MKRQLQAVILDWAGTTLDYGCMAPMEAFREVYAEMGVPITEEEARAPMGAHKRIHIQKISQMDSVRERWHEEYNRYPNDGDVSRMFEIYKGAQSETLSKYRTLIDGTLEAQEVFRDMGLRIGTTTGYTGEQMGILLNLARDQGYSPDVSVCATGNYIISSGGGTINKIEGMRGNLSRPKPHMCNLNALLLDVDDNALVVKAGDTVGDVREGLNAGMWTIGLAKTGNEIGMPESELNLLSRREQEALLRKAYFNLSKAGAHYVVDSIGDVAGKLVEINERLARGEKP